MSKDKNTNPTKSNVDDVFKNLKYVDSLMNEAAKTGATPTVKESFENQLKAKLMEGDYKETSEGKVEENRFTDKQNNNYPTYNYNEAGEEPATPETSATPEAGADNAGLPTDTTGGAPAGPDAAANAGLPIDTTGAEAGAGAEAGLPTDTTGDAGAAGAEAGVGGDELPVDVTGGGGASPSMGGGGAAPAGGDAGAAPTANAGGEISSPEDIEALVDELIDKDIEQTNEGSMGVEETIKENTNTTEKTTMENKATQTIDEVIAEITATAATTNESADSKESKPAGAETLTSTVAKAANIDQTKSQGDAKTANLGADYKDLGDKELEGKVSDKGTAHTTSEDFSKVGSANKIDQSKGQGNAKDANLGADYKDLGAKDLETKMKNESILKSKALFVLAEKYLKLEDELKAVKFENYKSLKANGILTLAPNLSEATKISLIKKFDECKTYKATEALYEDVIKLIKEDKKGNISESTGKDTSVKVISEEKKDEKTGEKKEVITEAQKRIMFLSGAKGFEDQYFSGNEIV